MDNLIDQIERKIKKSGKIKVDYLVEYCNKNSIHMPEVYKRLHKMGLMQHLI